MAERHQVVQKCKPFDVGGGTKHCGRGESRFVVSHVHPFEMCTPLRQLCFGGRVQLEHRKTQGCSASSSKQEGSASNHTRAKLPGEEWWKSSLRRGAMAKPKKSRCGCSLTEECRTTAPN